MGSYITLSDLGSAGGLCSQLQIYAGLLAVAKANNKQIVFSQEMLNGYEKKYELLNDEYVTRIRVFDLLDIDYEIKPKEFFDNFVSKHINFHTTRYDETLFNLDSNLNYNLIGRFDTYIYWYNDIGNEVAQWKYKSHLQQQAEARMSEIKQKLGDKPTVSIHIRRGDYLHPAHHFCNLEVEYYLKAIKENFSPAKDYNFVVFSNDIEYTKLIFKGDNVYFIEPKGGEKVCSDSEKEDLVLLSLCDHHITANSSYSWWGAYLSKTPNKKVVCPTNWLNSYHPSSWMNGNYYPPTWINIDNKS